MANTKVVTVADIENKVLALNDKFLPEDFLIGPGNQLLINPIILDALSLEYTLNGTDYYTVNNSNGVVIVQAANGSYTYKFPVTGGNLFNMRIVGGTATTLKKFKAELWLER